MRKALLNKISKCSGLLMELEEDIQDEISDIEEKQYALEERAENRDSGEMTDKEQEKYDSLEEEKNILENVLNEIECNSIFDEVSDLIDYE